MLIFIKIIYVISEKQQIDELMKESKQVVKAYKDWYELGIELGLSVSILDITAKKITTSEEAMETVLMEWIITDNKPSIKKLVSTLTSLRSKIHSYCQILKTIN